MSDLKTALENATIGKGKSKSKKNLSAPTASELMTTATPAKSLQEALANVLLDVPKSAQTMVTKATEFVVNSLRQRAKNHLALGEQCSKIRGAISKQAFSRWLYEVLSRAGASRASIYRWMDENEVLTATIPYDVSREAMVAVTDGRGLFNRNDGTVTLTGAVVSALKKHPAPATGTYEECLDWAHEVQVAIEKAQGPSKKSAGEIYKSAFTAYKRILHGGKGVNANHKLAVEFVIECYRELFGKSVDLAHKAYDGFDAVEETLSTVGTTVTKAA